MDEGVSLVYIFMFVVPMKRDFMSHAESEDPAPC